MRVIAAFKYLINLALRIRDQEGLRSASLAVVRLISLEAMKIPRLLYLKSSSEGRFNSGRPDLLSADAVKDLVNSLEHMALDVRRLSLDPEELRRHRESFRYPRFYAGGSVAQGGAREMKIVEYFVSLKLTPITANDIVIDVASEYSVFPDVVRQLIGARVFQQDLIYRSGIDGDRIGGSAAQMNIDSHFTSKLILHNAFEHFEGGTDTGFVQEAWRILKPGGTVCIVPLFLTKSHMTLTDPLVDREDILWDSEGSVVPVIGYRNRLGRLYSPDTLQTRVIDPARRCGFQPVIYHLDNIDSLQAGSPLHFGLVLGKPE